jgi:hypothetical protein
MFIYFGHFALSIMQSFFLANIHVMPNVTYITNPQVKENIECGEMIMKKHLVI